jgi:hypothetical protein
MDVERAAPPIVNSALLGRWISTNEANPAIPEAEVLTTAERTLIATAVSELSDAHTLDRVLSAADNRLASLIQTRLAEDPDAFGGAVVGAPGEQEARFDNHDPRYLRALLPTIRMWLKEPRRDPRPPLVDTPHELGEVARVALFGDWGTDLYGAPDVSDRITEGKYDAVIHLGDTYYTGSAREIKTRLLARFPTVERGAVRRVCSSNHEMYSGGRPFYELALPACEQRSTVFTLQNDHWLIVGLDTGFDDGRIDPEQITWLTGVLAARGTRRLVLLGHHHPWSSAKKPNAELVTDLKPAFDAGVLAWYWGHVHACEIYEPTAIAGTATTTLHGRCIGHGGYPYFRRSFGAAKSIATPKRDVELRSVAGAAGRPAGIVLDGPNAYLGQHKDRYGPNGFLRLELDGPALREVLVHPDGTELWSNPIQ